MMNVDIEIVADREEGIRDLLNSPEYNEQPTTCGKCGSRTEFFEMVQLQCHTCLNPECKNNFIIDLKGYIQDDAHVIDSVIARLEGN